MLQPDDARRALTGLRNAIGWSALLAPRLVLRVFGVDPRSPGAVYLTRLFGVRDVLMAYQLYQARSIAGTAEDLEEVRRQGILVDASDVLAALAAGARGTASVRTSLMGATGAGAALALGVASGARTSDPPVTESSATL